MRTGTAVEVGLFQITVPERDLIELSMNEIRIIEV